MADGASAGGVLFYSLTRACNARCTYCFARRDADAGAPPEPGRGALRGAGGPGERDGRGGERAPSRTVLGELPALLRGLRLVGVRTLVITGGEPLASRELSPTLAVAAEEGFRVVLITNGTLVTEEWARRLRAGPVVEVTVSIVSLDAAVSRELRGVPSTGCEAAETLRRHGVPVVVNCVVTRRNLAGVPALLAWASERGLDVDLIPVALDGPARLERALSLEHLGDAGTRQLAAALELAGRLAPRMRPRYRQLGALYLRGERRRTPSRRRCRVPEWSMHLDADGTVRPCFYHRVSYGNVLEDPLEKLVGAAREVLREGARHFSTCRQAACFGLAGGRIAPA